MDDKLDVGVIIDGFVRLSPDGVFYIEKTGGERFYINAHLQSLLDKDIRLTMISIDSIKKLADLVESSGVVNTN